MNTCQEGSQSRMMSVCLVALFCVLQWPVFDHVRIGTAEPGSNWHGVLINASFIATFEQFFVLNRQNLGPVVSQLQDALGEIPELARKTAIMSAGRFERDYAGAEFYRQQ